MEMKNLHTNNKQRDWFSQNMLDIPSEYYDYYYKWNNFALKYNKLLFQAASESYKVFLGESHKLNDHKKIQNKIRATFDSTLQQSLCNDEISSSLTSLVDSWLDVIKLSGYDKFHANYANFISAWSRLFEPIRNNINRTPSEYIKVDGKFNLHHYKPLVKKTHKTPLLIVYSLINRYYILDIAPNASVINNLRKQGFDIYSTSWVTPDFYDKNMTLENFAHDYIGNAVDKIKQITGSEKVSLFGYCWGGIFALIYAASHPENVKNLVLHATPVDMSQRCVVVENWTAQLDVDKLVDTLGNVPGWFVNLAFILRNPVEPFLKYFLFFRESRTLEETQQFFGMESWLYDSKPIIGEAYREIVTKITKNNLLIQNQMKVGSHMIDLSKITIPVLNIFGSADDLVPPDSSKPLTSVIGSQDKKMIEFPTGHVGLCLSQKAHEQLWPKVGQWLAQRS